MLQVRILCVGKLKERYFSDAVEEYAKRMKPLCRFSVEELAEERAPENPSPAQIAQVIDSESERMEKKLKKGAFVIAMCVEGKTLSSEELSETLENAALNHGAVDFLIGGSWGMSEKLKQKADLKLSMGRMTFPHQLTRVMLSEQIYRAFQIQKGTKYHK